MKPRPANHTSDEGYLLISLVVVCFLLILALGVAAPRVAKQLERDREVESEHRAQEYVRAIQLYYRKTQRYPSSIEQLLGSGTTGVSSATNIKYLRQQYKDPLTHDDFRLILVGTAKTEVKGFFGEPLAGVPAGNLGAVVGLQSNPSGTGVSAAGGSTPGISTRTSSGNLFSSGSSVAGLEFSGNIPPIATPALGGAAGTGPSGFSSTSTGVAGNDATTFQGSKGAFVGVGSKAKGPGQVEWNGSENIEDWEFLYDPRVEVLKAKVNIFGGSPAANGSGSLGGSTGAGSTSIFAPGTAPGASGTGSSSTGGTPTPSSDSGTSRTPQL